MRHTEVRINKALKKILMKVFSEDLSSQIIRQNYNKNGLKLNGISNSSHTKLINSIASDYEAIKPTVNFTVVQLKKDMRAAVRQHIN
ncbi:MAG: hypothetical protein ABFR82_10435 [Nitrospirota bacterium]